MTDEKTTGTAGGTDTLATSSGNRPTHIAYQVRDGGDDGFWTRLGLLSTDALFVWGRHDVLVPIAFMKHVERTLPGAKHVELNCGHVPQVESPRETLERLAAAPAAGIF